ncbi:MAG: type II toxin-antitoxin system RelE family toxin [Candidatus Woesearchaeota archaeon]
MSYKILPTKEFSKDFKKLDGSLKSLVKSKITEVSEDPTRFKHLHYDLKGSCRIRIKKLRVIFSCDEDSL